MKKLINVVFVTIIPLLRSHWKRLAVTTPILLICAYIGLFVFVSAMQGRLIYVVKI